MLDKNRLKNKFKAALQDAEANGGNTREGQLEYWCDKLAEAIVDEIKEAKVNYTNGLVAGATPVTGAINHSIT